MFVHGHKSISGIDYNYLNLPRQVTVSGKGTVSYSYDALGVKQKKTVTEGSTVTDTYYINGMEYNDSGQLRQIPHEEGRIRRKPDGSYIYDYYVRDHLGSVRVTLTEEQPAQVYSMVSMEPGNEATEEEYYYNIRETRAKKPVNHPIRQQQDQYAAKLDGKDKKTGPGILLKVMPGDKLNISVEGWWTKDTKNMKKPNRQPVEEMARSMSAGAPWLKGKSANTQRAMQMNVLPAIAELLASQGETERKDKPKASLNWILLDDNLKAYAVTDTGKGRKGENAGFIGVGEDGELKKMVKKEWRITKPGYAWVFTSNQSEGEDVYFDNLMVMTQSGPLIEVNNTYPFGLTIDALSAQAAGRLENKYRFNGKEMQNKEWSDGSGLEWYDFGERFYDQQIARWSTVDPMSDKRNWLTPYNYVQNNPISRIDPDGAFDDYFIRKDGDIVIKKTDDSFDRFYTEKSQRTEGDMVIRTYSLAAQLEKNDQGLVNFPTSGEGFSRYGGVQPEAQLSGVDKNGTPYTENIGSGDHWLQPKAAAALFGVINTSMGNGLKNLALGDMSTSTGSDPAVAASKPNESDFHHKSHGHLSAPL